MKSFLINKHTVRSRYGTVLSILRVSQNTLLKQTKYCEYIQVRLLCVAERNKKIDNENILSLLFSAPVRKKYKKTLKSSNLRCLFVSTNLMLVCIKPLLVPFSSLFSLMVYLVQFITSGMSLVPMGYENLIDYMPK